MSDLEFVDPKQLLRAIRASFLKDGKGAGGVEPCPEGTAGAVSEAVGLRGVSSWGALSAAADAIIRKDTAQRMECIKRLREEEALTVHEAAALLGWDAGLTKSQFLKLRQLGLIEQAGCRETRAGIEVVYRLNVRNPALEFVLAPAPAGLRSPHEVSERVRRGERWGERLDRGTE